MNRDKQIEEIHLTESAILANDIAQMCPDLVNSGCGDLSCVTCIAKGVERMGYRKASEVAREIFEEIEKWLAAYSHLHRYAEEAKKVTEEYADGSPVEMTSVWDACRLEHNGYDNYETMCQLQDNIGNIEKSRLLKEIEGDIAYFKKKYTEE